MYKLTIVDDEIDFRGRIIKIINNTNIGFELIGNYDNGLDALEGIMTNSTDVLITDIKMPFMDGITLIKNIRKDFPLLKIIIVSGFDEFDYAKEAIDLGVSSFITKPITIENIESVLIKVKEELDNEKELRNELKSLITFKEENIKQILSNEFNNLISKYHNKQQVISKLKNLKVNLEYKNIVCCYIDLDEDNHEYNTSVLIEEIILTTLNEYNINTFTRGYVNVVLFKSNDEINVNELSYKLNECIIKIHQFINKKVSIGLSLNTTSYPVAFNQAKKALELRTVLNGEQVFLYNKIDTKNMYFEEEIQNIKTSLINNKFTETRDLLKAFKETLSKSKISINNYNIVISTLTNILLDKCQKPEEIYEKYENILLEIIMSKTIDDTFLFLENILTLIFEINKSVMSNQVEIKLSQILNYIEINYKENLTLDDIAEKMQLTSNYICSLLKKHKNTTFVKHLTKVRMNKAIELLQTKKYKIVDVSLLVGYEDQFYFSHCFKKFTKKSPKEYLSEL